MMTTQILLVYILQTLTAIGIDTNYPVIDTNEVYCMAKNIYFEARGEGIQGQKAVALVTMNRVNNRRYPDTVCEVVTQKAKLRNTKKIVCAFSWACEKNKIVPVLKRDGSENHEAIAQFETSTKIAVQAINGDLKDITRGATHFHNPTLAQPNWAAGEKPTLRMGNHEFHRL